MSAGAGVGLLVTLAPLGSAEAEGPVTLRAATAVPRSCFARPVGKAPGVATVKRTAPVAGMVRVRLSGAGDWDVAVFDATTHAVVGASTGLRTNEVADGYVTKGQKLLIQACRYGGKAPETRLRLGYTEIKPNPPGAAAAAQPAQIVEVATPTRTDKRRLQALGLDLTEAGTRTSLQVLLHGDADATQLRDAGFTWRVKVPDVARQLAANRAADRAYAAATKVSALPSGRTTYRHSYSYDYELKELARRYPTMVRAFVLPRRTVEGRDIGAIEIALDARHVADGKPVFLSMGVHHAREWPSAEHTLEWAYELLKGYGRDPEITRLVRATRNIIVPVVNPDGFAVSREAPARGDFSTFDYEMKRKNCEPSDSPPDLQVGICANNPAGRTRGTDPNRNYGGFWGGPGASTSWSSDTFRGAAPFSAPEVQAVRELISSRQVTNLITNHTYSGLVLRVPGIADVQPTTDEPAYAALGARMAAHNGYANELGYQLYDTTGTTEDWSYWNTGGFAFTYEIGTVAFHPPFASGVVDEYTGAGHAPGAGKGGNRAAYLEMLRATADPAYHSVITGRAPAGWRLAVHKQFASPTSPVLDPSGKPGAPILYEDTLGSSYTTPGGRFAFHVNPSTRPLVGARIGRDPVAPPQQPAVLANPPGQPAENPDDPLTGPHEEVPFTIQGPPQADNGKATVHVEWGSTDTDWDLYVVDSTGTVVAQSATGGTREENAILLNPAPGQYRAVLVSYDQVDGAPYDDWSGGRVTFEGPKPALPGVREAWTLTCSAPSGRLASVRSLIVDRGHAVDVGDACRKPGKRPRH